MYCCCVHRKANLVDDVLNYMRLQEIDFYVLQALIVDSEVILISYLVLNI